VSEAESNPLNAPEPREVIVEGGSGGFAQSITAVGHRLAADEPVAVGGTGTGPGP
jgi:putative redox protein